MCFPAAVAPAVVGGTSSGLIAGGATPLLGAVAASGGMTAVAPAIAGGFAATAATGGAATLLTAGNIFTGISALGTVVQAFGTQRQSRAASGVANFNAQQANNNALIAEQNATLALEKGEADVEDKQLETRQKIGFEKARLAAMGFFVDEGSSVEILADTAVLGQLDVLRITADAENRARNFRQQAGDFQAEAQLGRLASKNIETAGDINTVGTLVTGAANAGTTFLATKTV